MSLSDVASHASGPEYGCVDIENAWWSGARYRAFFSGHVSLTYCWAAPSVARRSLRGLCAGPVKMVRSTRRRLYLFKPGAELARGNVGSGERHIEYPQR